MVILTNVAFLIFYNEVCQYLGVMHKSAKHYFPNAECTEEIPEIERSIRIGSQVQQEERLPFCE